MFVRQDCFKRNLKQFIYNKEVPKGISNESAVRLFLEQSCNSKGASPYKNFFTMQEKKNFVSEIAVSYTPTLTQKTKITNSYAAEKIFRDMWDMQLMNIQEQFCVLFLNNANEVIGFRCLSTGTLNSSLIDLRILFGIACKSLTSSIVIAHNHPSGKLIASNDDIEVTHKIKQAGDILDIKLLDHIILTNTSFLSLAHKGII